MPWHAHAHVFPSVFSAVIVGGVDRVGKGHRTPRITASENSFPVVTSWRCINTDVMSRIRTPDSNES